MCNNYYIVREILLSSYQMRRIDEEGVFVSFDRALEFINQRKDPEPSEDDIKSYQFEIVAFNNDGEKTDTWLYDISGKLLYFSGDMKVADSVRKAGFKCCKKFNIGDIVFVEAFPWNLFSPIEIDIIGVITQLPDIKATDFKDNQLYEIYYVNEEGKLEHNHFVEDAIKLYSNKVSKNHEFLNIYSQYLKGTLDVDNRIFEKVCEGDVIVVPSEIFDLRKNNIIST